MGRKNSVTIVSLNGNNGLLFADTLQKINHGNGRNGRCTTDNFDLGIEAKATAGVMLLATGCR